MPRTFTVYITDNRYSVPTLRFVQAQNLEQMHAAAQKELNASNSHLAVEVCENGRTLFTERREPQPAP